MGLPKPYFEDSAVQIFHADCRLLLPLLPKVDLVLTDPPYGVTQNEGDIKVDLRHLFSLGLPMVVFSQQPFTTELIASNRELFRYDLIWNKVLTSGFLNANRAPLRQHEIILVFGDVEYTPVKSVGVKSHSKGKPREYQNQNYGDYGFMDNADKHENFKYPTSILAFAKPHPSVAVHRTEKPVSLMSWLLQAYSSENQLILDPFMGSGTTLVAAQALGRKSIGIEIEEKYCRIAVERLEIAAKRMAQSVMKL